MIHQDFTALKSGWTKVSAGNTFVSVQLKSQGAIMIMLKQGPASTAPTDPGEGTLITNGGNFSVGGLPADIDCWGLSKQDTQDVVNVLAY